MKQSTTSTVIIRTELQHKNEILGVQFYLETCIYENENIHLWGGKGTGNVLKRTKVPAHKYINSTLSTLIFKHCRII